MDKNKEKELQERFDSMTHEQKESFHDQAAIIMKMLAMIGDKDAILATKILEMCEKLKDLNITIVGKDDNIKDSAINFIEQLHKLMDDFIKEMGE